MAFKISSKIPKAIDFNNFIACYFISLTSILPSLPVESNQSGIALLAFLVILRTRPADESRFVKLATLMLGLRPVESIQSGIALLAFLVIFRTRPAD